MYPFERLHEIVNYMRKMDMAKVSELSQQMDVSESTIRRDLQRLESDGIVEVHYGVAKLRSRYPEFVRRPYPERAVLHAEEKSLIAKKALGVIDAETSILLDAGSTTAAIAKELQSWPHNLTVVTTTLETATILKSNSRISVVLIGGLLRGSGESMVGELAEAMLDRLHVPIAFVGAAGVTVENGVMYADPLEAQIRRKIVQRSAKVVLVADHSKFGKPALVSVFPLDQVHCVITGYQIPSEYHQLMVSRGINVMLADRPESLVND